MTPVGVNDAGVTSTDVVSRLEALGVPSFTPRRAMKAVEQRSTSSSWKLGTPLALEVEPGVWVHIGKATHDDIVAAVEVESANYLKRWGTAQRLLSVLYVAVRSLEAERRAAP